MRLNFDRVLHHDSVWPCALAVLGAEAHSGYKPAFTDLIWVISFRLCCDRDR